MKALTIKEPFVTAIIKGIKKYEFRTWKTNYRGKILIHAGLNTDKKRKKDFNIYNLKYNNGKIIGEVTLTDCILVDEELNKKLYKENNIVYKNNHIGLYAWKLENPIFYKNSIEAKGKLGLWNYNN